MSPKPGIYYFSPGIARNRGHFKGGVSVWFHNRRVLRVEPSSSEVHFQTGVFRYEFSYNSDSQNRDQAYNY